VADQVTVTVFVATSVNAGFRHSYTQQPWLLPETNTPFAARVYVLPRESATPDGLTTPDAMPISTNSEFPAAGIVVASAFASVPAVTTVVAAPDAAAVDPMLNGVPSATTAPSQQLGPRFSLYDLDMERQRFSSATKIGTKVLSEDEMRALMPSGDVIVCGICGTGLADFLEPGCVEHDCSTGEVWIDGKLQP